MCLENEDTSTNLLLRTKIPPLLTIILPMVYSGEGDVEIFVRRFRHLLRPFSFTIFVFYIDLCWCSCTILISTFSSSYFIYDFHVLFRSLSAIFFFLFHLWFWFLCSTSLLKYVGFNCLVFFFSIDLGLFSMLALFNVFLFQSWEEFFQSDFFLCNFFFFYIFYGVFQFFL